MDERDYEKNSKEGIYPEDYSPGSNKCVSWKCRNNPCGCHEWKAEICYKTGKNKTGCPYCYHKPCPRNNLKILYPELMDERDYEKNSKEGIYPEECTSQTHKEVWWMCRNNPCGCHERSAFVYNRTGSNSGRPYCFSGRVCPHNNLKILHPELMDEWDYEKNSKEGLYPEELSFGSGKYVWWRCQKDPCGCHSWYVSIVDRTREESRHCLYCSNKRVCPHNNLGISYPELMDEWNYGNQYRMILIPLTYYFFDFKFFFLIFPDAMFGILSSWILLSFIFISKSF